MFEEAIIVKIHFKRPVSCTSFLSKNNFFNSWFLTIRLLFFKADHVNLKISRDQPYRGSFQFGFF